MAIQFIRNNSTSLQNDGGLIWPGNNSAIKIMLCFRLDAQSTGEFVWYWGEPGNSSYYFTLEHNSNGTWLFRGNPIHGQFTVTTPNASLIGPTNVVTAYFDRDQTNTADIHLQLNDGPKVSNDRSGSNDLSRLTRMALGARRNDVSSESGFNGHVEQFCMWVGSLGEVPSDFAEHEAVWNGGDVLNPAALELGEEIRYPFNKESGAVLLSDPEIADVHGFGVEWEQVNGGLEYTPNFLPPAEPPPPAESYNELFGYGNHPVPADLSLHVTLQDPGLSVDDRSGNAYAGQWVGTPEQIAGPRWNAVGWRLNATQAIEFLSPPDDMKFRVDYEVGVWAKRRTGLGNRIQSLHSCVAGASTTTTSYFRAMQGFGGSQQESRHGNQSTVLDGNDYIDDSWRLFSQRITETTNRIYVDGVQVAQQSDLSHTGFDFDTHHLFRRDVGEEMLFADASECYRFARSLTDDERLEALGGPEPLNTTPPDAPSGILAVGESLTADEGIWDDRNNGNISAYEYQWYRADDDQGTGAVFILGARSKTYTLAAADDGKHIACSVVAGNDGGTDALEITLSGWTDAVGSVTPPVDFDANAIAGRASAQGRLPDLDVAGNVDLAALLGTASAVGRLPVLQLGTTVDLDANPGAASAQGITPTRDVGRVVDLSALPGNASAIGRTPILDVARSKVLDALLGRASAQGVPIVGDFGNNIILTPPIGRAAAVGRLPVLDVERLVDVDLSAIPGDAAAVSRAVLLDVGGNFNGLPTVGDAAAVGRQPVLDRTIARLLDALVGRAAAVGVVIELEATSPNVILNAIPGNASAHGVAIVRDITGVALAIVSVRDVRLDVAEAEATLEEF